jgi:hypothetical protein
MKISEKQLMEVLRFLQHVVTIDFTPTEERKLAFSLLNEINNQQSDELREVE